MKRPWNLPDLPVYSLATYDHESVNMNVCTYVSAVSMKPKRYMVAVYHGTQTLTNLQHDHRVVLQLLGKHHVSLVNVLGKRSGARFNKESYLMRKDQIQFWKEKKVLKNCAALIEMKKCWMKEAGDHTIFVFDVTAFQTMPQQVLTLNDLRARKLISV